VSFATAALERWKKIKIHLPGGFAVRLFFFALAVVSTNKRQSFKNCAVCLISVNKRWPGARLLASPFLGGADEQDQKIVAGSMGQ
jgi:hypothetical protein